MIYVVDEKEVGLLKDGTIKLAQDDAIKICVKDEAKPVFTASDVQTLLSVASEFSVDLLNVTSKESLAFVVGGFVFNNEECTLVHIPMTIPAGYEDKIHILEEGKKATKPRKRTRKAQPVPDSSAKAAAPATSNDVPSVASNDTAPVVSNKTATSTPDDIATASMERLNKKACSPFQTL